MTTDVPLPAQRAAFETWCKEHRRDLSLQYMYDDKGQYHHDGYLWADTGDAWRLWQIGDARAAAAVQAERERMVREVMPLIEDYGDAGRIAVIEQLLRGETT
jgi:hypothetical protein